MLRLQAWSLGDGASGFAYSWLFVSWFEKRQEFTSASRVYGLFLPVDLPAPTAV
jgi:hypothetical protein